MTKKTSASHTRSRTTSGSNAKNRRKNPVHAATQAIAELGHAAEKALESWQYVKEARRKGDPVVRKTKEVSRKATRTIKKVVGRR